jgi:hypothetical protein
MGMALERSWDSIGPVAFIADGGADGVITIASVAGMRVKQEVVISGVSLPTLNKLEIKRVLSPTKIIVGPIKTTGEFLTRANLSAYTAAALSTIKVIDQDKKKPPAADILSFVYEPEGAVALRTFSVDELGNPYTLDNPLPVRIDGDINIENANINVKLSHLEGPNNTPADSIRIGDGTNEAKINSIGELNVIDSASRASLVSILDALTTGGITVSDPDTHALLTTIIAGLVSIDNGIPAALGQTSMANSMPVTFASDQSPIEVNLEAFTGSQPDNVQLVGSIDGTKTGSKFGYVNNIVQQILSSHDRDQQIAYADFGTKNQRVVNIDYTSPTFSGVTARKNIAYTLVGNKYRRDSITWVII